MKKLKWIRAAAWILAILLTIPGFAAANDDDDADAVAFDKFLLTWDKIRGDNEPTPIEGTNDNTYVYMVTKDLSLPSLGGYGSSITWSSDNTRVLGDGGTVADPTEEGDAVVLRAVVEKGTARDEKIFRLIVKKESAEPQEPDEPGEPDEPNEPGEPEEPEEPNEPNEPEETEEPSEPNEPDDDDTALKAAKEWLTWDKIRGGNSEKADGGRYAVTENLFLPAESAESAAAGIFIVWASGDTNAVTNGGEVNRSADDVMVNLTASFKKGTSGAALDTAEFPLTVIADDRKAVERACEALTWEVIRGQNSEQSWVTEDLTLPAAGEKETAIEWSSDTDTITDGGVVTRPQFGSGGAEVKLTAVVSRGKASDIKEFLLTVPQRTDPDFIITDTGGGVTAKISADAFRLLSDNGAKAVEIRTDICDILLDAAAARSLCDTGGADIAVTLTRLGSRDIPAAYRPLIGERPALEITVSADGRPINGFGGGAATVAIPYTPTANENIYAVVAYNIDGTPEAMRGYCGGGAVRFKTKHLSKFAVGYNPVTYADVPNDWARDAIDFIAARGYTVGVSDTLFEPGKALTRGEFTANLMKAYNIEPDPYARDNFADVDSYAAYAPYLATAKKMGLVKGADAAGSAFAPERQINRAEMFALLYNILAELGELPTPVAGGRRLSDFSDADEVGAYFVRQVEALLAAGLMQGVGGDRLDPKGLCARRTMAQMIFRLMTQ